MQAVSLFSWRLLCRQHKCFEGNLLILVGVCFGYVVSSKKQQMMDASHILVSYLLCFVLLNAFVSESSCGEYHEQSYPNYESKQYEYHHDYHPPPPPKKAAHVDINIPIDISTIAKLGVVGLTQLKLLMALGKIATAGLGVGALGLGSLGKLALSVAPAKKSVAIDLKPVHHDAKYHHYETHHYPVKRQQNQHY